MKKQGVSPNSELKNVYRKAKPIDIEKWESAIQREDVVMLRARKIAMSLDLNMKIGDVEFQGDGTKAIFYYIADERIDFRQLIKDLADEFKIRIEMRQIGARQEAGRIGGIASCGRTLCCSSWMTDFVSVTTNSARYQEISLNPQKLAGQCGKLKCCLNYEVDSYKDAQKDFPPKISLETAEGTAYYFKTDVYRRTIWYSFREDMLNNVTAISVDRANEILAMNKTGKKPQKLAEKGNVEIVAGGTEYQNVVGQESLTRFQNTGEKAKKKRKKHPTKNENKGEFKNIEKNDNVKEIKIETTSEKIENGGKKIVLKKSKSENVQNNETDIAN
jgi:cell fate regulator YaaT (PSP1 superfamily)